MDLEFTINNQTLKRTDSNKPANWSDNYLQLVFNFESDDWTGLNKYCLLRVNGELYRVELDNDQVTLPVGVLTSDRLIITLYGSDDEDYRITTNMVSIILGKSGYNIEDIGDIPDIEDIYALIESKASTKYVNEQLSLKADTLHTHSKSDITDFTHTHTESDITDLKDYALVSDVPTKTSDLTNDSGFITQHQDISGKADKSYVDSQLLLKSDKSYVDTELDKKADITDVPTKTSDLTNDVPFLTEHQSLNNYYTKTEVNQLIYDLNNKMNVNSDKTIIQTGETSNITIQVKEHGFPAPNKTVNIYEKEE